jgi:hypothetical protein
MFKMIDTKQKQKPESQSHLYTIRVVVSVHRNTIPVRLKRIVDCEGAHVQIDDEQNPDGYREKKQSKKIQRKMKGRQTSGHLRDSLG